MNIKVIVNLHYISLLTVVFRLLCAIFLLAKYGHLFWLIT